MGRQFVQKMYQLPIHQAKSEFLHYLSKSWKCMKTRYERLFKNVGTQLNNSLHQNQSTGKHAKGLKSRITGILDTDNGEDTSQTIKNGGVQYEYKYKRKTFHVCRKNGIAICFENCMKICSTTLKRHYVFFYN